MTTKAHLVNRVALATGRPKAELERTLEAFLDEIGQVLLEEGRLELRGFGVFHLVERKAHAGTHPQTGEVLQVEAVRHVGFRTGKRLHELLNP